jgi:hypothetical protein
MFPGTGRIKFVTTLTSTTAPSVAEINAGVELTGFLRQDGLNRTMTGNTTDIADATDTFDKTDAGTFAATFEATFLRDSVNGSDTAFSTLVRGTRGYFVIAPFGFTGAGTPKAALAADRCEVWTVVVTSLSPDTEGPNKAQIVKVTCALPATPVLNAVAA